MSQEYTVMKNDLLCLNCNHRLGLHLTHRERDSAKKDGRTHACNDPDCFCQLDASHAQNAIAIQLGIERAFDNIMDKYLGKKLIQ